MGSFINFKGQEIFNVVFSLRINPRDTESCLSAFVDIKNGAEGGWFMAHRVLVSRAPFWGLFVEPALQTEARFCFVNRVDLVRPSRLCSDIGSNRSREDCVGHQRAQTAVPAIEGATAAGSNYSFRYKSEVSYKLTNKYLDVFKITLKINSPNF